MLWRISTLKRLYYAFSNGATIKSACRYAKVTRKTFYSWLESKPGFRQKIEQLKQSRNELVVDALFKAASKGDVSACKAWLKNKAAWKFGEGINVNATATAGVEAEVTIDADTAKTNIKRNSRILKEYGLLN